MISIPDKLLERLDLRAKQTGETRSGFLRRLAERELEAAEVRRREEINRLLDQIHIELPAGDPEAWDVARLIREDRESH
jgi:metal-responsive CopG/Arc/MetJ family transcriptional regulator